MEYIDFDDNPAEGLAVNSKIDIKEVQSAVQRILQAIGEDPERDGLKRTPERIARMYAELLSGYQMDPVTVVNEALFEVKYDEMVIVRDIEFYSLCEHHMLPFMGRVHVAYIPDGKVAWSFQNPPHCGSLRAPPASTGTYDPPDRRFHSRPASSARSGGCRRSAASVYEHARCAEA